MKSCHILLMMLAKEIRLMPVYSRKHLHEDSRMTNEMSHEVSRVEMFWMDKIDVDESR